MSALSETTIKGAGSHLRRHFNSVYHQSHYDQIRRLEMAKRPTEVCFKELSGMAFDALIIMLPGGKSRMKQKTCCNA
jgi:hypothetical protein